MYSQRNLFPARYFYVLALRVREYSRYVHTEVGGKGANTYFKTNSLRIIPFWCHNPEPLCGDGLSHFKPLLGDFKPLLSYF